MKTPCTLTIFLFVFISVTLQACKKEEVQLTPQEENYLEKVKSGIIKKKDLLKSIESIEGAMRPLEEKMLAARGDKKRFIKDDLDGYREKHKKLKNQLVVVQADIKRNQKKLPKGHRLAMEEE